MSNYRISPPKTWPEVARASRPPESLPAAREAHRQTGFLLGTEVDLLLRGLELEGATASASAGSKFRNETNAALLATWSRAWLVRLQALHAAEWGNYVAAMPLIRAAAELTADVILMDREDGAVWSDWLEQGGVGRASDLHATEFRLHPYRAAEILAENDRLGPIYRASNDLSMGHFGASLLFSGPGSDSTRLQVTFGDRDFHLGLAELCVGWLLEIGVETLEALSSGRFALDHEAAQSFIDEAAETVERHDRCRLRIVDYEAETRYLIEGFRRKSGQAPARILL